MPLNDEAGLAPEDQARAALYRIVARFLTQPPSADDLTAGASIEGDESPLGRALSALAQSCRTTTPEQAAEAFQVLFIGLGRGELVPYASYYLTGFLQEKPLARLRADMDRLGIERSPEVTESEDHIASILEIMAAQIDGAFGAPQPPAQQKRFFDTHVASWADHFFSDLRRSETSPLYQAVGDVGGRLMEIETEAFKMA